MMRKTLLLLSVLCVAGCGGPPAANQLASANDAPGLKPPVKIITFYGNTITCQAGPGAVCVQR